MNLFKSISGLFTKSTQPNLSTQFLNLDLGNALVLGTGNHAAALAVPTVYACVNLLSSSIASLPMKVYKDAPDGGRERDKEHPLYALLHDRPNPNQTAFEFFRQIINDMELAGNAYIEIRRFNGQAVALYPRKAQAVRKYIRGDVIERYTLAQGGTTRDIIPEDMIHIIGAFGDFEGGVSPLKACHSSFEAASTLQAVANNYYKNGMFPSAVITYDVSRLNKENEKLFIEQTIANHSKSVKAGTPLFINDAASFSPIGVKAADAQLLESRRYITEEICRVFQVPPPMIYAGDGKGAWPSAYEQQAHTFYSQSLKNRIKNIQERLKFALLTPQDRANGVILEFDVAGHLAGTFKEQLEALRNAAWLMRINEARGVINLGRVDGGDELFAQSQNVPITQLGEQTDGIQA